MKLRMIPYGYKMIDGKVMPAEQEANVVQRIFNEYVCGKGLKSIADSLTIEKVPILEGNAVWSKNRIKRILTDERYIGVDGYPAILADKIFIDAKAVSEQKSFTVEPRQPLIDYLTHRVVCGQCGARLHRLQQERFRGSWCCSRGCSCEKSVTDNKLLKKLERVLLWVYRHNELLLIEQEKAQFMRTPEIIRYSNEIGRMIDSLEPSFSVVKSVILECATVKFKASKENRFSIYTEEVTKTFEKSEMEDLMTLPFIEDTVSAIIVKKSGDVTVRFMNDAEVDSCEAKGCLNRLKQRKL